MYSGVDILRAPTHSPVLGVGTLTSGSVRNSIGVVFHVTMLTPSRSVQDSCAGSIPSKKPLNSPCEDGVHLVAWSLPVLAGIETSRSRALGCYNEILQVNPYLT